MLKIKAHTAIRTILFLLLAISYNGLMAQLPVQYNEPTVKAAEYFWDADLGAGNGYTFTAQDGNFDQALEKVISANATLPAVGLHTFNVRIKDGNGNWGPLFKKAFQVEDSAKIAAAVKLTAAEYFWDTDPGYGAATTLLAFDGNFNQAMETVFANTTSLPAAGLHLFNIRVRDSKGSWGPLFKKAVSISDAATTIRLLTVKSAEYFWDTDPGYGAGNTLLAFDGNFNQALEQVFTSNAVLPSTGVHLFNVRIKSENNTWGPLFKKAVQVTDVLNNPRLLTVKAAEYFWDTDPGYGSASTLLAFDGNFNEALEDVFTNNATLPASGIHLFNIRVKSENNTWGPLFKKAVQVGDILNNPRLLAVTAAECFWDTTDPGYGNGITLLAFDGNFNQALEAIGNSLNTFTQGLHLFNLRARDENNKWGPLFKKAIQVDAQPRQFIITAAEYFWDADPGYGNGYQLLAFDGNFNQALETAVDYNGNTAGYGLHLFNIRVKDEMGRWGPLFKRAELIIADFTNLNVTLNYTDTATVCAGDSVFLQASGAASFTWYPATGLNHTNGAGVLAGPAVTTTYMVIGQGEPEEFDTAYVTVKVVPGAAAVHLGNDTSICSPATVTLNAGPGNSYSWSTGQNSATISVNTSGDFSVAVTNISGCVKRDTIHITVDTINNAAILPATATICNGQNIVLNATGGNQYTWSNSLGTNPNVTVSPTTATTYSVTITKGACVTSVSRLVSVNQSSAGNLNISICQGQSYFFNGVNRTTAGSYLDTLVNVAGCDSILTLNLTVKQNSTGTINASICQGQTYFFNGVNRTTAGSYLDTLVNAVGCDSLLTLNLTVKQNTTGTINASICQGQAYFFNGVNRTTAGSYLDTLLNAAGCDSILTLNLTVKQNTTGTINVSICQGQAYFFNGVNRTTAGSYLDTLVNAVGCDSILTLNLTVKQNSMGTINASICQGQAYFFNGVNRTTAGSYLDTLVNAVGCDSILTLNLTVKQNSTGTINASICQGQAYFFNGVNRTTAGSYLDTLVNAVGCDSILTLNLTVKQNSTGTINASICQGQVYFFNGVNRATTGNYLDTLVNTVGCDSILTLHLIVNQPSTGTISTSICQGQSYLFNGANRTTTGVYLDTLTNVAGCDSFLTLNLAVNSSITGSFNQSICAGSSYLFNGQQLTQTGAYLDTLQANGGCDSIVTLHLTVNQPSAGTVNATICQGQSYFFNGVNRTTGGVYLDTLVNAAGCDSILTLNLTVKQNTAGSISASICQGQSYFFNGVNRTAGGVYLDTLVNAAGCDSILTLNLTVKQNTAGSINASICQGQSYFFNGFNRTTAGTYLDTLVNAAGCDSILTLNLTVKQNSTGTINASICQGQVYFFNGLNRTTTGSYSDTLVNAVGCDSILTLHLTVNQPTSGTIIRGICQGQSYFFNGVNYTTSGVYLDTLVNAAGCDSILTLNLTVNNSISSSFSAAICSGSTYLFNGQQLTQSGSYKDTLQAMGGCDSVVTLLLTVNQPSAGSITAGICQGQSYFFNGVNLTAAGTYLDTLVNTAGCDSVLTLNLTVNSPSVSSISASICQGQQYLFNGVNLTTGGMYSDTLTNAAGCDSIVTLNLTVIQNTSGNINASICQGQTYFFNGVNLTATGIYLDTLVNAAGCDSILTLNLNVGSPTTGNIFANICQGQLYFFNGVNLSVAGTYLDTLINAQGCDSIVSLNLSVNSVINTSYNYAICGGEMYLFNGVQLTQSGVYKDTLQAAGGCDSVVTLNLAVNQPSSASISVNICQGQSYLFNGINLTSTGVFMDTLVNANGCDSLLTLHLSVTPTVVTSIAETICAGSSYLFGGQQITQAGVYYDTLQTGTGCDSIVELNLAVGAALQTALSDSICAGDSYPFAGLNITQSGQYFDTLQTASGCDSIVALTLTVLPLPQPVVTRVLDTLYTQSFVSYQWLRNNTPVNNATAQTLVLTQTGNYSVVVTDVNGCSDTAGVLSVLSVNIEDVANVIAFKLYPNPNTGKFVVEFADDATRQITVTDAIGRLIVSENTVTKRTEFALGEVASGVYFLNVRQSGQLRSIKFNVVR